LPFQSAEEKLYVVERLCRTMERHSEDESVAAYAMRAFEAMAREDPGGMKGPLESSVAPQLVTQAIR
jgi:hypothetical protein